MSSPAVSTRPAAAEDPIDALLAAGRLRRRAGALTASAAFGRRAMLKLKHDPKQLVDSSAIPILFTVLFTYLFGGAISGSTAEYLKVLLPGVLSMSIAIVTMYGGGRLAQDVRSGAFDRFRGMPVWRGAFVLGGLLSDVARYLFASAIVVVLGLVMGYRPDGGVLGVLAAVALVIAFGLALSLVWAAVALAVRDPAVVISIANAVLMPLSFASNIFVQPSTMPGWLQAFVDVNPLSHVASAARDLMNDTGGAGGAVAWSLIATAVIALVCGPITLRLYSKQG
ncbi:ABC transporter permease [Streptomyces echinatus]|uniref:Transport permease protein n=1 Tax=Streptomyces echinatus TaxID=67293 RepID=A0A7W9UR87_9ACTN|nr:ABC transporter permease [Streptomyces echinatus]MBB5928200.1 ABC-2 type transport system permease protein [Streptomyces echinatus]